MSFVVSGGISCLMLLYRAKEQTQDLAHLGSTTEIHPYPPTPQSTFSTIWFGFFETSFTVEPSQHQLADPLTSASQMPGLEACVTTLGFLVQL